MADLNEDVFSCILAHIWDAKTLHSILATLPQSHLLFPVALGRLWQLPIYLDAYDPRTSVASREVLDYLLGGGASYAASIRHLVMHDSSLLVYGAVDTAPADMALHERLPNLLRRLVNLESLDYHSGPGIGMNNELVQSLHHLERMRAVAVDCTIGFGVQAPSAAGGYAVPGELSGRYDAKNWEMQPFLSTMGPQLTSLELRQVNHTMFMALASWADIFATFHGLEHLKIDITDGVWDWDGGGSPAMGASSAFIFPFLGLPSVKRFELVVCDKTLSGSQKGPLNLVHCHLLTVLIIDVRYSLGFTNFNPIKLFESLSPWDFPELLRLEIKDNNSNTSRYHWDPDDDDERVWRFEEREYPGLVPSFLGSMRAGSLPKLDSLWVDEKTLIPRNSSLQHLLDADVDLFSSTDDEPSGVVWREALGAAFHRLKSLRIGFGAITHLDAELILRLCDPTKLTQFGFEWNWSAYGQDEPFSPELLVALSRFPKLADVHILFPRPGAHLPGTPDPVVDARTIDDVQSIFQCNGSICRVGIGNSVVWERHPSEGSPAILLVSDGSITSNPAVPKFYHAGFMSRYDWDEGNPDSDNTIPPRPLRGQEIEQLRDLLQRIM